MEKFSYKIAVSDGMFRLQEVIVTDEGIENVINLVYITGNVNYTLMFDVPVGKTFEKIAKFTYNILHNENLKETLNFKWVHFKFNGIDCTFSNEITSEEMIEFFSKAVSKKFF